jgi:hypothetical protein
MHPDALQCDAQLAVLGAAATGLKTLQQPQGPARSRRMALHRPCGSCTREQPHALRKRVPSVRALSGLLRDRAQALFSAWFLIGGRRLNTSARKNTGIWDDMQNSGRMPCRDNDCRT